MKRSERIADEELSGWPFGDHPCGVLREAVFKVLVEALERAIAEEREACAKIAMRRVNGTADGQEAWRILELIRKRSQLREGE